MGIYRILFIACFAAYSFVDYCRACDRHPWTAWSACQPECGTTSRQRRTECICDGWAFCRPVMRTQTRDCIYGHLGCVNWGRPSTSSQCSCPPGYDGNCCGNRWTCPIPSAPENGIVIGDNFIYQGFILYSCHKHFELIGDESRICLGSQQWSGSKPLCQLNCPCQNGGTCDVRNNGAFLGCLCRDGYFGDMCQSEVSCGSPPMISGGFILPDCEGNHGDAAEITCQDTFLPVGGNTTITCELSSESEYVGVWTTTDTECMNNNLCVSHPCLNGATCENGPGSFVCHCPEGFSGTLCEKDIQPPVVIYCPKDDLHNTKKRRMLITWENPVFSDPHNTELSISSNHPSTGAELPWGRHQIIYTAIKLVNSFKATCEFQIAVFPFPCSEFPTPRGGALACNQWNSEFGSICGIFCEGISAPPMGVDIMQLMVCGSDGIWSPPFNYFNCSGVRDIDNYNEDYTSHFFDGPCQASDSQVQIKENYLTALGNSQFYPMCTQWGEDCSAENVEITCNGD